MQNKKEGGIMVKYFCLRLEAKKLNYNEVVAKYPQFKDGIDEKLAEDGYAVDGDGWCYKIPKETY